MDETIHFTLSTKSFIDNTKRRTYYSSLYHSTMASSKLVILSSEILKFSTHFCSFYYYFLFIFYYCYLGV